MAFQEANERLYLAWLTEVALPFWAECSRDPLGGFVEAIDHDGCPLGDLPRRVRVQARHAFAFAKAAQLDWFPAAKMASDHAFDQLLAIAKWGPAKDAAFVGLPHLMDGTTTVLDGRRDTYDHAFALLACASRIEAFQDTKAEQFAVAVDAFLQQLCSTHGGYLEGRPATLPRRQNPHMHLFEAYLALYKATKLPLYRDRYREIYALFDRQFLDHETMTVREQLDQTLAPLIDPGQSTEPGHGAEWVWLLHQYSHLENSDQSATCAALLSSAMNTGLDESGLLINSVTMQGVRSERRRCWPQTEYARALLVRAQSEGSEHRSRADEVIGRILHLYISPAPSGGYYDEFTSDGELVSINMPSSTLYHLVGLGLEIATTQRLLD